MSNGSGERFSWPFWLGVIPGTRPRKKGNMHFESFLKRMALLFTGKRHRASLHAAIICKGKRIFGMGVNEMKTHPMQSRASAGVKPYLHAEIAAILDADEIPARAKMVVIRLGKDGKLMNSKPCAVCMSEIRKAGIDRVVYSDDGGFKKERYGNT